ncbi:hypothetical protein Pan153_32160 [Gimesia panareensis]|uniref:SseB protein N-terminal domain-containing protein n=2 Tax=Gimesia panareensis TaxID=2527978 RepID=A0A518FQC9_9PLAN|nr:hypothetical protein Pan153_32160 [Gimesia panareensis]
MTLNEVLAKYKDSPVGVSIVPMTRALENIEVYIPVLEAPSPETRKVTLKISKDKRGLSWAYFYTDRKEFSSAFPEGSKYVATPFKDAFNIIKSDSTFGGIFINRSPEMMYLIPKEVFDQVSETLDDKK